MDSMPLFDLELLEVEMATPYFCSTVAELKHLLKQQGVFPTSQQELGCQIACRRSRSRAPFTTVLAAWRDGNWSCLHEEFNRDTPIAPGQYQKAYYASRDEGKHFYHLETDTARDLLLHA
ncbi:hypothetical protein ACSV5M_06210 [Cellvibrio sp. ARAG 10.3]|uniref:hypothetical protein n=1 Tax=Cellvibrio sp. ARAG 10.3 TaxID=3451358 RepID=UPI003F4714E8